MNKEEKVQNIRHSLAHLLAAAVAEIWPDAKPTIGPPIENGFYYDFEFPKPISDSDIIKIEKKMKDILPTWESFERLEVSSKEAKSKFKNNSYKLELIDELSIKKEKITLYTSGKFTDLCRGGHVENMKKIDPKSFALTKIAGAYWRGDEKNTMLTRIYGVAFETAKELRQYNAMMEEAKKRDHRKLGAELDLFTFSELVGGGLPLFTPRGTIIKNEIEKYLEELQLPKGYQKVTIPHLAKKELYVTSGHWDKFADNIFHVTGSSKESFVIKPMNCPHHTQIYASRQRSYRDLPIRYFEVTEVYRDEKAGQLMGLSRVRSITQDDAHCFCMPQQVEEEGIQIYDVIEQFYKTFKMKITPRLSIRDPKTPEKYIGSAKVWDKAEDQLRKILKKRVKHFEEIEGEAAFYGPKIDFDAEDAIGRKWQLATIQLDFAMPERFGLEYIDEKGTKQRPVMIHRAVSGSFERFFSVLIENYAGDFPVWLAPVQAMILPVSDKFLGFAEALCAELKKNNIRAEIDASAETIGNRIRKSEILKIPFMLVVGEREEKGGALNVRMHGQKIAREMTKEEFIKHVLEEIRQRK